MIRDWFRLVLWYIRIRKASKTGIIHSTLLEVESRASLPQSVLRDPLAALIKAEAPSPDKNQKKSFLGDDVSSSEHEIEDIIATKLKEAMKRSNRAKREFFSGCKL